MCPFDDEDPDAVKPKAIALWHEHQALQGEYQKSLARIAELERQIKNKNKKQFGRSTERRENPDAPAKAAKTKDQTGHGRREQPALEIERDVIDLPKADQTCTVCGGELEEWEENFETSSEIDIKPKRYVVRESARKKYRCRCGACIKTAPAPEKMNERGGYTIGFGVDVGVEKYADGKSLECQVKAMRRSGLVVDSQTLWDQIDAVAHWCLSAYRAVKDYVFSYMHIGADETTWRLMENEAGKTGSERWWIWIARAPDAVYYTFEDSRSADAGGKLFDGFEGVITCDGYKGYQTLRARNPQLLLAHCWSHVRRAFIECESSYPKEAKAMIALIGELFGIEKSVKDADLSTRLRVRKERSAPLLHKIAQLGFEIALSHSTQNRIYVVTKTMNEQWEGLTMFLRDARIPLHNNVSEQSARQPVLGRKIHQGSRSERGTKVAAILYTLCETAKLAGVEPRAYLHLSVLRAIRGQPAVVPHEVTSAMLIETLSMSEVEARALIQRPQN